MANAPVLIIDLAKYYGGADVRVIDLARSLHGARPYAVATLNNSPLHQRLQSEGLTALPVPYTRGDPRLAVFIWRAIRREGFRVVDAHNPQSQFWGHLGALFGGARRVSTIHSAYRLEHNNSPKGRAYEQILRLNRWWGNRFIAVSEAVYNYLREVGIPETRVTLIHNSQRLPEDTTPDKNIPLMQELGWGENEFVLVITARLEPVKAHNVLIDAVSRVKDTHPQIRLLIVGDGRLHDDLTAQVKSLNLEKYVHFAGFRNDIPALLRASNAFTLPSLSEGLPYALLEAASYRLPVLVSKVGGMAALLTHQENGYFVPPSDVDALAEGIDWLITHPEAAAAMGSAAYELVRQKFSPEKMISETLEIYDS